MLTFVCAPASSVTGAGVVPQLTLDIAPQVKLKVFWTVPVFCTVNEAAFPLLLAVAPVVPACGVIATPVPAVTVTLTQPLSPPPAILRSIRPEPVVDPVLKVTSKFMVMGLGTKITEGAEHAVTVPLGTQGLRLNGRLMPVLFVIENVTLVIAFATTDCVLPLGAIVWAERGAARTVVASESTTAAWSTWNARIMGSDSGYSAQSADTGETVQSRTDSARTPAHTVKHPAASEAESDSPESGHGNGLGLLST